MNTAHPPRGRPGRASPLTDRANHHIAVCEHRTAFTQVQNCIRDNLADQSGLVLVDIGRSGMPRRFLFVPFHSLGDSRDRQQ